MPSAQHMVHARTLPLRPSGDTEPSSDHTPASRLLIFEGNMKSGRRAEKKITSKELTALFREWQELRDKVSKAELAAAQRVPATTEPTIEEGARKRRKTAGRSRTH